MGFLDLDLPCDIRDIIADVRNLAQADEIKWDMIAMLALDLIGLIPVIGALKYSDEVGTLFKNAGKVSVVAEGADGVGAVARHADEAGAWLQGVKVFRYSDETAEAVASGEKLLKESGTIYESFADMMSPEDAAKYLDFLENGSKEGLTSAELAGVEKADALLVSQKVGYEDVWDLRNVGDALESGNYSSLRELMLPEEVARYDEHWLDVAEKISNEALDNQIDFIKNGGITKPGGGAYKPAKISAAVDLNTGDIYFGYNGANKFNPSIQEIHPDLQQRINRTMSLAGNSIDNEYASRLSFEKWSVDNCAEI